MRKIFTCLLLLALFALSVAAQGQTTIDLNGGDQTLQSGTYIISNYTGSNRIIIAQGAEVTVTLDNVQITTTTGQGNVSPFDASKARSVTLLLKGKNTLTAVQEAPGLYAPQGFDYGRSITIKDAEDDNTVGSLSATGAEYWPGIGIEDFYSTNITIESGKITATGGRGAAGIGADGSYDGTITISGGTVTAIGGRSGDGIGAGANGSEYSMGTFSTGENGSAVIFASSITDNDDKSNWSGVIFEGNIGKVYGTPFSLTSDFTIPSGYILPIPEGTTLIIPNNITVTNNGTIINYGTVTNNGTINGSGIIYSTSDIANAATTKQESTSYIDCNGTQQVAPTFPMIANMHEWIDGWYVVTGDMTFNERITIPGDVTLILADGCNLNATQGINVGEGQSLTIYAQSTEKDMGALIATGGENNAGIGGDDGSGGTIIISGGTVTATGGVRGAGIGGGNNGEGGTIIISGGTVTATGGSNGAGIGGSQRGSGGTITISGGTVTATGNSYGAGIGGGNGGNGGTVTITGGTVTATGGSGWYGSGAGIGTGGFATEGTFSTGENGNAVIFANSITDNDDTSGWSGVIFVKNDQSGYDGKVYGNPAIESFTMESNHTLEVPTGVTLTIPEGVTLYNNGTITNSGTISGDGRIVGNKPTGERTNSVAQYYYVTRHLNYEGATDPEDPIEVKENETIPSEGLTPPTYYTFEGWYDATTEGNKVESATTNNLEVYAHWTPNSFTTKEDGIPFSDLVYGRAFEHTFTETELSDNITTNSNGLKSIAVKEPEEEEGTTNALPAGLTLEGLTLSGTPTAATPSEVKTVLTLTANNGATADITLTFTIAKATPTIILTVPSDENLVYDGKAKIATATVKGVGEDVLTAEITYYTDEEMTTKVESVVNAGTYYVKATYEENENYKAAEAVTGSFTITAATATLSFAEEAKTVRVNDNTYQNLLTTTPEGLSVTYTSSNTAVATVDENGTITAKAVGTTTITAQSANKNYTGSATYTLTVEQTQLLEGSNITITGGQQEVEFTGESTTMTLTATVKVDDGLGSDGKWTWKSSNTDVATVPKNGDEAIAMLRADDITESTSTATVTILKTGTATITAHYSDSKYEGSVSFTIIVKAKEEEPAPIPDPMPQPDPDPIYYNIYLDDVCEGVEASLSRGFVKEGNQVSVYVEVEEGYDAENLKVSFKRSLYGYWEEVEEGVQPGEYIIYNVYADIYIKVEGVEKIEEPTGMEDIEGAKVYTQDGNLYVYTSQPQEVTIITMNGAIVKRERQEGWRFYSLPKGIYIIGIGEERMKVRL